MGNGWGRGLRRICGLCKQQIWSKTGVSGFNNYEFLKKNSKITTATKLKNFVKDENFELTL